MFYFLTTSAATEGYKLVKKIKTCFQQAEEAEQRLTPKTLFTRYYFYAVHSSVKEKKNIKTPQEVKLLLS